MFRADFIPAANQGELSEDSLTGTGGGPLNFHMGPWTMFEEFTPHARVITAIGPFLMAIVMRLILGKNKLTRMLLSLSTTWFAINVLLAPYSGRMQAELQSLRYMFR
jgi:hypothetical protein